MCVWIQFYSNFLDQIFLFTGNTDCTQWCSGRFWHAGTLRDNLQPHLCSPEPSKPVQQKIMKLRFLFPLDWNRFLGMSRKPRIRVCSAWSPSQVPVGSSSPLVWNPNTIQIDLLQKANRLLAFFTIVANRLIRKSLVRISCQNAGWP